MDKTVAVIVLVLFAVQMALLHIRVHALQKAIELLVQAIRLRSSPDVPRQTPLLIEELVLGYIGAEQTPGIEEKDSEQEG